jgi:hypothetical protein
LRSRETLPSLAFPDESESSDFEREDGAAIVGASSRAAGALFLAAEALSRADGAATREDDALSLLDGALFCGAASRMRIGFGAASERITDSVRLLFLLLGLEKERTSGSA